MRLYFFNREGEVQINKLLDLAGENLNSTAIGKKQNERTDIGK